MFEVMVVLSWIVFGIVIGLIAQWFMRSRHTGNLKISIILGAIGSLIGGLLGRVIFGFGFKVPNSAEDLTVPSYILSLTFAVLGAIILDSAYRIAIDRKQSDG